MWLRRNYFNSRASSIDQPASSRSTLAHAQSRLNSSGKCSSTAVCAHCVTDLQPPTAEMHGCGVYVMHTVARSVLTAKYGVRLFKQVAAVIINNSHDNVYGAVIMTKVIARVHPVHLMNVD